MLIVILDFGFWILDFGFWILDFGSRLRSIQIKHPSTALRAQKTPTLRSGLILNTHYN